MSTKNSPCSNYRFTHLKKTFQQQTQVQTMIVTDQIAQSAGPVKCTKCFSAECPVHDTKQSDDLVPVMLELWRMRSTPLLPSPSSPLWPGVVAFDRVLSMGQKVLMLNCIALNRTVLKSKLCIYAKLNRLK